MWLEAQPSAQSFFQKSNTDNSCQKHAKLDITFLKPCPILPYFFSLCHIFRLGLQKKVNDKDPKFQVDDHVRILKYKTIY